jgi:hypothetical protein
MTLRDARRLNAVIGSCCTDSHLAAFGAKVSERLKTSDVNQVFVSIQTEIQDRYKTLAARKNARVVSVCGEHLNSLLNAFGTQIRKRGRLHGQIL